MARSPLTLRPLLPDDLAWLLPIERAVHPMPWVADHFAPCWTPGNLQRGFGGWLGARAIGYWVGLFVADEAHLLNLAVAPTHQRQGWGSALLAHFLTESRVTGVTTAWLEVRSDNAAALALYQRAGFQQVAARPRYYRDAVGCYFDALVMALPLGSPP